MIVLLKSHCIPHCAIEIVCWKNEKGGKREKIGCVVQVGLSIVVIAYNLG